MKIQIRSNVFETNSSSMHSLVVTKTNEKYSDNEIMSGIWLTTDYDTKEKNCVWNIHDDELEFGRYPFRILGSFKDKWLYACASLVEQYNDGTYLELVRIAKKYIPGLKTIKLPLTIHSFPNKDSSNFTSNNTYSMSYGKTESELIEFLSHEQERLGCSIGYYLSSDGSKWIYKIPYIGYVDDNVLTKFLKMENITLEEFLINKKYIVIQDGDEYCDFVKAKKTGLINLDFIDREIL